MDKVAFEKLFASVKIDQGREEFFSLVNIVENLNPHIIIEIGVEFGGSLKFWEQLLKPGDMLIGVDILVPRISWDWTNSDIDIVMITGNSTEPETVTQMIEQLALVSMADAIKDKQLEMDYVQADFLYLDGDHSLDTVQKDFKNYSPLVRSGGIVGFHDLHTDHGNPKKVFDQLQGRKEVWHLGGQGTGLWWKP